MGVFAKRKWKQGWRVSGNASVSAMPKNVSPVDRSDYDSNRISPCKVQLEPQLVFWVFQLGKRRLECAAKVELGLDQPAVLLHRSDHRAVCRGLRERQDTSENKAQFLCLVVGRSTKDLFPPPRGLEGSHNF